MSESCPSTLRHHRKPTRLQNFLRDMNSIVPWKDLIELIRPYYYEGKRGRPPRGIELLLRMTLLQSWFTLSDRGIEEAVVNIKPMADFLGLDLDVDEVPDATTLLKFRHLLEKHDLQKAIFELINQKLSDRGLMMHGGTICDATLINAPSSTKNSTGTRDPEMHQTKKGNQYYFGMKAHIGVCAFSGYVHTLVTTAANVSDITMANDLIRDDDHIVYGDAGYKGLDKRPEIVERTREQDIEFRINRRRSSIQKVPENFINWEKQIERRLSSVRSKVEHPFRNIKGLFGFGKTVYRGLKKNTDRLFLLLASSNLLMCVRSGRLEGASL